MSDTATLEAPVDTQAIETQIPDAPAVVEAPKPITVDASGKTIFLKSAVCSMFELLGYGGAAAWAPAKINQKIGQLPGMMVAPTDEKEKKDYDQFIATVNALPPMQKEVLDTILAVAKAEGVLEVVADEKATKVKKAKTPKTPKAPKDPSAPKGKKIGKTAEEGAEKDNFGSRKGTRGFEAMSILEFGVWKKIKDVVKAAGREGEFVGVFYNFLNDQVKKGNVAKDTEKGYTLTQQGLDKKNEVKPAPAPAAPAADTPAAPVQ